MKISRIAAAAALSLGIGAASPAWSILITNVEVGNLDTIIAATSDLGNPNPACQPGSNVSNESCWANAVLDAQGSLVDLVFNDIDKIDPGPTIFGYGDGVSVDTTVAAFDFGIGSNVGYYIIKNATLWVLVLNNDSSRYGVIDAANPLITAQLGTGNKPPKFNIGDGQTGISHITPSAAFAVPEPTSLALLGAGLLGFGLNSRRRRKAAA